MQEQKGKRRKARVDRRSCVACGCCVKVCPMGAVAVKHGVYACVDEEKCVGCGRGLICLRGFKTFSSTLSGVKGVSHPVGEAPPNLLAFFEAFAP